MFVRSLVRLVLLVLLVPLLASAGCATKAAKPEESVADLQGEWDFNDPRQGDKPCTAVFEKDTYHAHQQTTEGGHASIEAARGENALFRVDRTQSPANIDFIYLEGANQGKTRAGIFVLEGDTLQICVGEIGGDRPTGLAATDAFTLLVLKRKK
jgi:uncharacterized protein (TIGR03067 family)